MDSFDSDFISEDTLCPPPPPHYSHFGNYHAQPTKESIVHMMQMNARDMCDVRCVMCDPRKHICEVCDTMIVVFCIVHCANPDVFLPTLDQLGP